MAKLRAMLVRRRKLAIAVLVALVVYTLAGFLLVPWIVRRSLPGAIEDALGLEATVEKVRTNPYTLTATVEGFTLARPGGDRLLGFDSLFVNFQLSSLFRWAWTFKTIRLTGPGVDVVLDEQGNLNLAALVPPAEPTDTDTDEPGSIPRVIVYDFQLESGRARFEDRTRPVPFVTEIGPTSFKLEGFSTLPERSGDLILEAALESGARFAWSGTLAVNPLHSEGHVSLNDGHMPITERYLQDQFHFDLTGGTSDIELDYVVSIEPEGARLAVSNGSIALHDVIVTPEEEDTELLRVPELRLAGIALDWPANRLAADELTLDGVRLAAWREPDGTINLLPPDTGADADATADAEPSDAAEPQTAPLADWSLSLARLAVTDFAVSLEDRTVDPAFRTGIAGLDLEIRDIDNSPDSLFPTTVKGEIETGGAFALDGRFGILPTPVIDTSVRLDDLSFTPIQPYVEQFAFLRIDSGTASAEGTLTSNADEMARYRGTVSLADVAVHDLSRDEQLVGLGRMGADDLLFDLTAARLRVSSIELDHPYGRLTIYEDGSTNVGTVVGIETTTTADTVPATATTTSTAASTTVPFTIEIGEIRVVEGSADFADLSLPLPFASRIDSLDGGISEIASGGSSARIELEGTVDEYGLARVAGSLDLFAPDRRADVSVAFRNVEMSNLSPYATKFAGYAIERGRLSLNLKYTIHDRQLESENEILIDELTLGDKVDSPDAPKLPVKLAVALLKDKNGRIELDIPVGGTLDDPQFAYGKLVWKAVKNVMTKIATAPFRALARLVGSDKDLEFVEFAAAANEITPPAREKLEQLEKALAERPQLVLEVRGVYDPDIDGAAIRVQKLEAEIARLDTASEPATNGDEPELASDRRRRQLETLFVEHYPAEELDTLAASHTQTPAVTDGQTTPAEPVLDLSAYLDALSGRLLELQPVTEEELTGLADARARALGAFFEDDPTFADGRVRTAESGPIKRADAGNEWVRLRLILTSN